MIADAVEATAAALGIDPVDAGEHAGLLALCQLLAERIDAGQGGKDAPTELRRTLNDLRRQVKEDDDAGAGPGVIERLRAV